MELKKNPRANVGRNSSLYFAVGLNVMLLLTYLGLEHKTYESESAKIDILMLTEQLEEEIPITTINIPPPPPPKQVVTQAITIVEDVEEVEETFIESTEIGQDDVIEERVVSVEEVEVEEICAAAEVDHIASNTILKKVGLIPSGTFTFEGHLCNWYTLKNKNLK